MPAKGKEFYIPHKAIIRENAATTKMRMVYDASALTKPDLENAGPRKISCSSNSRRH